MDDKSICYGDSFKIELQRMTTRRDDSRVNYKVYVRIMSGIMDDTPERLDELKKIVEKEVDTLLRKKAAAGVEPP